MSFKFGGGYTGVTFTALDRIFDIPETAFIISAFGRSFEIKWYGVIIAFGFTLAVLFGGRIAYVWKVDLNKMIDILIYGTFAAILGARSYHVFSKWSYYSQNPREILNIRGGGLAIYGALIGGILAAFIVCKIRKVNFNNLLDMAGMSFLIGQGIGRWGNFTNQEVFGYNTSLPWGMWSPKIANTLMSQQLRLAEHGVIVDPAAPVHPTFLYESLWCLAGFGILYLITKKFRKFSGQTFLCYGMWYGVGRCLIEGLRVDNAFLGIGTIRSSQVLSASIAVFCAALLVVRLIGYKKNPKPVEGIDFFIDPAPGAFKRAVTLGMVPAEAGKAPEAVHAETEDPPEKSP